MARMLNFLCVLMGGGFGAFSHTLAFQEPKVGQSFRTNSSCFIANTPHSTTGKRLVDHSEVVAFAQTQNGQILFTPSGAYIGIHVPKEEVLPDPLNGHAKLHEPNATQASEPRTVVLKAGFQASLAKDRQITPRLEGMTSSWVNFFVGPKAEWRTHVPTYRSVVYDSVWPGISLEYLGLSDHLTFKVILEPGSDPNQILLETGCEHQTLMADGRLQLSLAGAEWTLSGPQAYQEIGGVKVAVPVAYQPLPGQRIGFSVGPYAAESKLVIEPKLIWSTYLGAGGLDFGMGVALDPGGNILVSGLTSSGGFPTTSGTYDQTFNGDQDIFVSKFSPDGGTLLFSTYIGGSFSDQNSGIAVDSSGNAYITGHTFSNDYPTTLGANSTTINGSWDVFVTKLSADGSQLLYSTYLGGTDADFAGGIALDSNGNTYVTGYTYSTDYPTTSGAFDESFNGNQDVFVSKLNAAGNALIYSTYLGGMGIESGKAIALDSGGNAYSTGFTGSSDFPVTSGAYDETFNSGNVFVSKLNSDGSALIYATFIGESATGTGIAVDANGNAFVAGETSSMNYPTTSGAFDESINGLSDAFVSKLNPIGSTLMYSTFLGGTNSETAPHIALDGDGNVYLVGSTNSSDFPTTSGAFDPSHNGEYDVFISQLNPDGSILLYSTFIGGSGYDTGNGIARNAQACYATGYTASADFPSTNGAYDETANGGNDVFLTRICFAPLSVRLAPSSLGLGLNAPTFTALIDCANPDPQINWFATPSTPLMVNGTTVSMDPPPSETTVLEVVVTDSVTLEEASAQAYLLVSLNPGYEDFNQDGCNNLQDLWDLAPFWHMIFPADPDNDGTLTVMDFLYINLTGPFPCP
ncbi:MAG: SBBP repeat-containing protein [Acidobacteria bacterium]|nr:SBBP repeat-containing protein [Acidobacteriota bacterium]MCB9396249.1 SBBP repeat-containing protein [Acidobacteriota bacterium]